MNGGVQLAGLPLCCSEMTRSDRQGEKGLGVVIIQHRQAGGQAWLEAAC